MPQAEELQKHENLRFKCRCSFLEIYNEQIADLLDPSSSNLQVLAPSCPDGYVFLEFEQSVSSLVSFMGHHKVLYLHYLHGFEADGLDFELNWFPSGEYELKQMREDVNKGVYVEGLLEVEVQNVQDVLHLLLLVSLQRGWLFTFPISYYLNVIRVLIFKESRILYFCALPPILIRIIRKITLKRLCLGIISAM